MPWKESAAGETELDFEFNCNGLIQLLSCWDSAENGDIIRQRLRHLLNIVVRKSRNKQHETAGQEWRASNSDWWHELEENEKKINKNVMDSSVSKAYFKDLEGREKDDTEVDLQLLGIR